MGQLNQPVGAHPNLHQAVRQAAAPHLDGAGCDGAGAPPHRETSELGKRECDADDLHLVLIRIVTQRVEALRPTAATQHLVRPAHRVGHLEVGELAVVVAAAAAHRDAAFAACRFAIDTLKETVPIWKKEFATDGAWWVDEHP